ncbi:TonB-dependent siderophore receptor [Pseudoalteromonas sp. SR41-4]|uniref:TonB-dependent receptor plug domain-containing protein n=2 Tax=Pseudoalteromonas TaxID=53246 RepID=UPI0015FF02B5|nr:TonB-dependent receptor [Pseudoalteromonas sp. SR41-4]MBB1293325.1 TonB-dependent receptor [Pseudoalteromonas sp. SR41-4]
MLNNKVSKAVRLAIAFGAASTAAFSATSFAAEEEGVDKVERIQVTGSRIKRTDLESASPVLVLDRSDIAASGQISIGNILQQIPAAGAALNTAFNNGGNGATNMDLRNLGAQRLLVLVNGKRWISSLGSTVDLNTIPAASIERVEVVKDGASAIYGSDAIAGVVNIITRKDFEGAELSVYGGENLKYNDGRQYSADLTIGTTSDKGGLMMNLSHVTQAEIWAGDRDISSMGNSSTTEKGRLRLTSSAISDSLRNDLLAQGYTENNAGKSNAGFDLVPNGAGSGVGIDSFRDRSGDVYNYAPENYLSTPQVRNSMYVQAFYDLSDDLRVVSDFMMTNRESSQLLAAMPLTIGASFGASASKVDIHANNIYNPFGETLYGDGARSGVDGYVPYAGQRRFVEAGNRIYKQNDTTYRAMVGLEGNVGDTSWVWDASYIYGKNSQDVLTTGLLNLTRINQALGDNCNASTSCVPLNLFGGAGSITPEMVDFVTFDSVSREGLELKDYTLNFAGDAFELPAGVVGMAIGLERREESGYDTPDPLTQSGETSGNQRDATSGGFRLDEAYVELSIPVIEGLTISPAIRFSDHSAYGSNSTAKVGVEYRPIDDILLRGTWAEGYRAPSISDLYAGNADSYPTLTDPCNSVEGAVPNLPGCAGVPDGYAQANTQIRITNVSSPDLKPEESESKTFGIVYNPSYVDGLEFTIDYYDIEVTNSIGRYGASRLLNECSTGDNAQSCDYIDRDANGNVVDLRNFLQNSGSYNVEGIDFFTAYKFDTEYGSFKTSLDLSYVMTNEFDGEDQVGIQYGDAGYPEYKGTFAVDWSMGDFDAHWQTRYVDRLQNYYDVLYGAENYPGMAAEIGSYFVHDVSVGYALDAYNTKLTLGIENLFAKEPSPEYSNNDVAISTNNFSVTEYDVNMDRFVYLRATIKF